MSKTNELALHAASNPSGDEQNMANGGGNFCFSMGGGEEGGTGD